MTATERERAELDDLRRRLYRADATPEDLRQYLDERGAAAEPAAAEAEAATPPRRRRPRFLLAGAVAAALLVSAAATGALLHGSAPHRAAIPASSAPVTVPRGASDGAVGVRPGRVVGPLATAITLDGAAVAAERFEGVGDGTVSIHLPSAEFGTLRAVVLVYSSRTSTISWTALRPPSGDVAVVARARVASHVDDATPNAFTYAGGPPTKIEVEAPDGLRWTLLVAAANGTSDDLR